jgi:hypothetical protein
MIAFPNPAMGHGLKEVFHQTYASNPMQDAIFRTAIPRSQTSEYEQWTERGQRLGPR